MKTAVVSGASYGIGKAVVKTLLAKGFKVYGLSRTKPGFSEPNFIWLKTDLLIDGDIKNVTQSIKEKNIDLLVNNAGTALHEEVLNYKEAQFEQIFGLNFKAPIKLTLALFPKLHGGLIVNISSLSDRFADGLYGSSKAALNNYFETIAQENPTVKIASILPSYVDTPLLRSLHDDSFSWDDTNKPEQTASIVTYLIDHPTEVESGGRIVTVSSTQDDGDYDPEKLYLFITDKQKLTRIK
jgi:NAD(P)-dependent dehydrogenase (short-subunit alcohol dehydrogenase family)